MLDSESPGAAESRHLLLLEPEYVRRLSHSLTRKPGRLGDSARKPDGRGRWPDRRPRPRAGGLGLDDDSRHARGRPRGPGLAAGAARRAGRQFRPGAARGARQHRSPRSPPWCPLHVSQCSQYALLRRGGTRRGRSRGGAHVAHVPMRPRGPREAAATEQGPVALPAAAGARAAGRGHTAIGRTRAGLGDEGAGY